MNNQSYLKKDHIALMQLVDYFLKIDVPQRIDTVNQLAERFNLSVGVVQKALKNLEIEQVIKLEKRGCQGSILENVEISKLIKLLNITKLVCAMPLPYTKLYEGLASGLKSQFNEIDLYFAHMRGAESRLECLNNGIYDIAVSSYLACEHWVQAGKLEILFNLGKGSYVQEHGLICRNDQSELKKIGIDFRSVDQLRLTQLYFSQKPIEIVPINYHQSIPLLISKVIDGVVWNIGDRTSFLQQNLIFKPFESNPILNQATEAVILIKKGNEKIKKLFEFYINEKLLLEHQKQVIEGAIEPCY